MNKGPDKKFLLMKIKLMVVGEASSNLLHTLEYMGFQDVTVIESALVAESLLQMTFYGFIVTCPRIEGNDPVEFIESMRKDSKSLCRFSPILAILDEKTVSKELITKVRDAGATEILLSPFEIIPFREKIVAMVENPRNFIIAREYTGPDRRRKKLDIKSERRKPKKD
ncbi:MAG: hypothetical protein K0R98_1490 [Rickettsiaceae bacterium]|jgi:hypothetical protein|nr:hypothetical protein [Rickettsiaceae bacterium]